ncbi:PQQ-binding-like beta-propeller repeat protein [Thalassoroseus pseudoceratinae]|uniref:PQQ-binding-like beta-propeller repeat protein n=1 Tax=Thalassoroseus pseudoceratinae TaxID=2713176 RepID=UPI001422FB2D|nr:PQQ-binding-like beta-propeller repeat protein [Thalassoroseus pseudoceratinae]
MYRTTRLLCMLVLCTAATPIKADNWPHWRGDNGNGVALKATPPVEWSDSKNVKWKVAIPGQGSGSPVIWEDKVFVVSGVPANADDKQNQPAAPRRRRGNGAALQKLKFTVFCFDRATGKKLWEQVATEAKPHQQTHATNNFASASPCTDGKHVYAHFGSRGLYCYTMDGQLVWKRDDLGLMETRNGFGEGSSPTLAGDKIIVPWDHEGESAIFALNKHTGKTMWKTPRDEPTCWATPLIVTVDGKKQIIMNGQTKARAYDLETGEELWSCGGQTERPAASAVAENGVVYIASGFRGSFLGAFRPDGQGDIEGTDHVLWTINRDTPDIASPLLSLGRLYFYKARTGILTCIDTATGKPHYKATRVPGLNSIYASPIAAGGYVYLTDRSGTIVVIKDSGEFEIVATNSMGETVDATPAPVDDELFVRGEKHLFCISGS